MLVLIAGGGTGGHLFPGVAVAEELIARGHQVRFVGTARGIEARVVPALGHPLDLLDVTGIKGGGLGGLVRGLLRVPRALASSLALVRRHRPQLVLGVGGYASGPLVLMAALLGIPTAILEQNAIPGVTNRILGRFVARVLGGFAGAERFFSAARYRLVGNPIRARLRAGLQVSAAGSARGVLVLGGSQGAHAVNELVIGAMKILHQDRRAPRLVHQTGRADFAAVQKSYADAKIEADVREFIDDIAAAYQGAKLVVTRAGASTLAELTAVGLPAILIPFPQAADDHQTVTAREVEAAGAARVLLQAKATPAELAQAIADLLADAPALERMAQASRALGRPRAHLDVVDELEALANARSLTAGAAR